MESFDYVILGAGLGGLSAAACLTWQGYRVAVLEKHYLPGGCCHTFDDGDYRFCADVHYISQCGAGQTIERFLSYIDRVELLTKQSVWKSEKTAEALV